MSSASSASATAAPRGKRACPECGALHGMAKKTCDCGHVFVKKAATPTKPPAPAPQEAAAASPLPPPLPPHGKLPSPPRNGAAAAAFEAYADPLLERCDNAAHSHSASPLTGGELSKM